MNLFRVRLVLPLILAGGCGDSTAPYPGIETRVEVSRAQAGVGDTVTLRAIATNYNQRPYTVGYGCGAGLDFAVRLPTGEQRFVLRALPSICPVFDSNVLEPGETDTVSYVWTIPGPVGVYEVRAGVRVEAGIAAPSAAIRLTVE